VLLLSLFLLCVLAFLFAYISKFVIQLFGYAAASVKYKKAVLPQGNRAMPQVFFSVEVRQQHSLQV